MARRRSRGLLAALLAGLLTLAGCTATLDGGGSGTPTLTPVSPPIGSPTETPTAAPLGSPSATLGECVAVEQVTVNPFRDDVEPSELPEPPTEWTRESVERYVVSFEEAYARNEALRVNSKQVTVIVGDVSVERTDGAWMIELTSRTNTWVQSASSGNRTATVVHGDGPRVPVTYRLTDRALYRTEMRIGGTLSSSATSAREQWHGPAVACFEA